MKVKFVSPFDWKPEGDRRNYHIAFKPNGGPNGDGIYTVKRECGGQAIAEGKALAIELDQIPDAPPATTAKSE